MISYLRATEETNLECSRAATSLSEVVTESRKHTDKTEMAFICEQQ